MKKLSGEAQLPSEAQTMSGGSGKVQLYRQLTDREGEGGDAVEMGKRAGEEMDDLALVKHSLLILSKHHLVLNQKGELPGGWVQS